MVRGMYSSATGMISQYKRIDVLGSNVANIDTAGFKRDEMAIRSFGSEIAVRMADNVPIGSFTNGTEVGAVSTDYTQGSMEQTGKNTDLAISGNGFFALRTAGGETVYTRGGNFSVDAEGYLVAASGARVLGADGTPVRPGGDAFAVAADGTVTAAGQGVGRIALYAPAAADGIQKRTDGAYNLTAPQAADGILRQGWTEGSNVDAVGEMTGMMQATRAFQSCQQAFQTGGDTLDRLINNVGSLKA